MSASQLIQRGGVTPAATAALTALRALGRSMVMSKLEPTRSVRTSVATSVLLVLSSFRRRRGQLGEKLGGVSQAYGGHHHRREIDHPPRSTPRAGYLRHRLIPFDMVDCAWFPHSRSNHGDVVIANAQHRCISAKYVYLPAGICCAHG